jgi:3-dehydroquinate synthase
VTAKAGVRTFDVALEPRYSVHIGSGALELARDRLRREPRAAVLTDRRVLALHGEKLVGSDSMRVLALEPGEAAKDLAHLGEVLEFLAKAGLDRDACLYTLGGGVIGDLGGFAAGVYMRGIAVVHCPTTLLAQVDASVGGKTAVNLSSGKNLAGVFHQPRAVYADVEVLRTLDAEEFASGLGEVAKCALISGEEFFARLEELAPALRAREAGALTEAVERCVRLKGTIVADDPRESGARRALNLGHTFAHAIERAAGYGAIAHGVAVAVGLSLAVECSAELGMLRDPGLRPRLRELLTSLGLPQGLAELRALHRKQLDSVEIMSAMDLDKKSRAGEVRLVLPRAIGELDLAVSPGREFLSRFVGEH